MMLLKTVQALLIVATILSATTAFALDCKTPSLAAYFGNGMFNSDEQAESSRAKLETFISANNLLNNGDTVGLAYNFNEAAAEQLLQVATQKDNEAGRSFFRWISNLSSAPEFFKKMAQTAMAANDFKEYLEDVDLRIQIAQYETDLKTGKVIVVVGHSQGNFYSNSAWENLHRRGYHDGRFALVGVATPTSHIAGEGPYSTLTQDRVMGFVRSLKGALPSNVTNAVASLSGHEFVSEYLEGTESGPKIKDDLKNVISKIASSVSTPSPAALEYLDQSLSPFLHHACKLQSTKSKFTDGECIALAALDRTYGWFGVDRKQRSLKALNEWIDQCSTKEFWQSSTRFDFLDCSMLSNVPSLDPSGSVKQELHFVVEDHPECDWQNQEVRRRTTPEAVASARALLNSTPKKFKLGDN
jgi:hypothetical protein